MTKRHEILLAKSIERELQIEKELAAAKAESAQWQESCGQNYVRATEAEAREEEKGKRIAELEAENKRLMAMISGINKGRFTETEIRAALPRTAAECWGDRDHLAAHLKEQSE